MKKDIILSGVGGQGILSVAAVIGLAAMEEGLFIKQSEVHGMSQRGGAVVSHLRISDREIFSDLIPFGGADILLSIEPMEVLRYLPYLKKKGWIITNSKPFVNIAYYPEHEKILNEIKSKPNSIIVDADGIARQMHAPKAANIVIVGAASGQLGIKYESLEAGIRKIFGNKGNEIIELNLNALQAGKQAAAV
jgi:indolepyruvate ferredoxin oxidoreductase beta subunit